MANRTTVKSNIVTKNVPTVTNAILTDMLNADMNDNVRFREDVAVTQVSAVSNITVDFSGKDRVDLTRTGGSLNITLSNVGDGEEKFLLITKTAGQAVTFVGVTDVTPVAADVTALALVLYEIVRKGIYYFAKAWTGIGAATTDRAGILETATAGEAAALTVVNKIITPGTIPKATTLQEGVVEIASGSQIDAGTDVEGADDQLVVQPSELLRKVNELKVLPGWVNITLGAGWSGTLRYYVTPYNVVHLHGDAIQRTGADVTGATGVVLAAMPAAIRPTSHSLNVTFLGRVSHATLQGDPVLLQLFDASDDIIIFPEPTDIISGDFITLYFSYIL
jgi:hypothetical protein